MNRRELYQFVERLRTATKADCGDVDDAGIVKIILSSVYSAMCQRRGGEDYHLDTASNRNEGELFCIADSIKIAAGARSYKLSGSGAALQTVISKSGGSVRSAGISEIALNHLGKHLADPLIQSLYDEEDLLGRIYQALNARALESAYRATAKDRRKFTLAELPAVTQLFTPRWVIQYLQHNTLGRRWVEWHPDTRLLLGTNPTLDWLVPMSDGWGFPKRRLDSEPPLVQTLRVLDPACGTMNFGLVAFDLLAAMYREELNRAGEPGWPAVPSVNEIAEIPSAVLSRNLFGIDIDPVALALARLSLELKSGVSLAPEQWNLWQADSLFDESISRKCLGQFDVVVTNPPYVSSRNLPIETVAKMKKAFPAAWRDLCACFIERSLDFAREGGQVGILTMQSFMFTGAYQKLRRRITDQAAIETLAHFGPALFDIGNPGTLQTVAFVACKVREPERRVNRQLVAYRLVNVPAGQKQSALYDAIPGRSASPVSSDEVHWPDAHATQDKKLKRLPESVPLSTFRLTQSALTDLPRASWAYWVDAPLRRAFQNLPRLGDVSPPRQGLATTDNARFVRYWWEVQPCPGNSEIGPTPGRWHPYAKGGQFRRWYEAPRHRVNWEDDGREIKQEIVDRYPYLKGQWQWVAKNTSYYGRVGVSWSYLTSGRFSARRLEAGSVFDVAGSSFFPEDVPGMLAILNSSVAEQLLAAINPTVNFQVGDLAELPVPAKVPGELGSLANTAITIQMSLDAFDETSPDFRGPMPWENAVEQWQASQQKLAIIQAEVDLAACDLYGVHVAKLETTAPKFDRADLAMRWVSHAINNLLLKWDSHQSGRILRLIPFERGLLKEFRDVLYAVAGETAAGEIEAELGGLEQFLAKDFYPWHVRIYRRRPPLWAFGSPDQMYLLTHNTANRSELSSIFRRLKLSFPPGWNRHMDDGIALGLAPLRAGTCEPTLRRILDQVAVDMADGRMPWSNHAAADFIT